MEFRVYAYKDNILFITCSLKANKKALPQGQRFFIINDQIIYFTINTLPFGLKNLRKESFTTAVSELPATLMVM